MKPNNNGIFIEVELDLNGVRYSAEYESGTEFTDAPEQREIAWVSILKSFKEGRQIAPWTLPEGVLDALDERALNEASSRFKLDY